MAHREETTNMSTKIPTGPKSDGTSSDICVVDNSNDTSPESGCWRHSSPANSSHSAKSHQTNKSNSSLPLLTPSPPNKNKPISSLKRMILAPSQPNSPKRPNKDIIIAIEKLRPIQKYNFAKPNGETPNLKFTKETDKFAASLATSPPGEEVAESTHSIPTRNTHRSSKNLLQPQKQHTKQLSQHQTPLKSQQRQFQLQDRQNQSHLQQILANQKQQSSPQKRSPQQVECKRTLRESTPFPPTHNLSQPLIVSQVVLKAGQDIQNKSQLPPLQPEQQSEIQNDKQKAQQQHMTQLQEQRQHFQQQLQQVEQQLQHELNTQQEQQLRGLLLLDKSNTQTPRCNLDAQINAATTSNTTPIIAANNLPSDTPPNSPPLNTPSRHKTTTYENQYHKHIINYRKSNLVVDPPVPQLSSPIPWTTQMEQQQTQLKQQNLSFSHTHSHTTLEQQHIQQLMHIQPEQQSLHVQTENSAHTKAQQGHNSQLPTLQEFPKHSQPIPSPQPPQHEFSNKIPSIFVPKIVSIELLIQKIKKSTKAISFSTISNQDGGVRIKCNDSESYSNLLKLLYESNIYLHTHQLPQDKGFRIVIKNLHATTPPDTIRNYFANQGLTTKYVNVLKNRFTGMPLNIFEVELALSADVDSEKILKINNIDSQEVSIERQARRTDPVQCHRCQAFGHSKNYCRRPFVCLKCSGSHPTTECKKDKNTPGLCANCGNQHIASYKGCPVYKAERAKLLAVKINIPPSTMYNENNIISLEQQQPPNHPHTPLTRSKQKQLLPNQPPAASQSKQLNGNTQPQIWQPLPQRIRTQHLNAKSPITTTNNARIAKINTILATQHISNTSSNRQTYSQVVNEAALTSSHHMAQNKASKPLPNFSHLPQPPIKLLQQQILQHQQKQEQQQLFQSPITQKIARQVNYRTNQLPQQTQESSQQIIEIKATVSNNERTINCLSEKVDMLYNLVNEYITPIIHANKTKANEVNKHEHK